MCCEGDVCFQTDVVRNFVYCVVFSDICCDKDVVVLRHKLFVPSPLKVCPQTHTLCFGSRIG